MDALLDKAFALYGTGECPAAAQICLQVLQSVPGNAEALHLLAIMAAQAGHVETALPWALKAIEGNPDDATFHLTLGNIYRDLGQSEKALTCYQRGVALEPSLAEAHHNLGNCLMLLGHRPQALDCFNRALTINPEFARSHFGISECRLLSGDLQQGWAEFEWRWRHPAWRLVKNKRNLPVPDWMGQQSLAGKTILLQAEQGMGDTLQFCRYATLVAELGARVILEVQPPLVRVLGRTAGVSLVVPDTETTSVQIDFYSALMSLPLALGTTLETIPNLVPYIRSEPQKADAWRDRLGPTSQLRVGLVWSGGHRPNQPELKSVNERRNIPLQKLAPLRMDGVTFYSLQKGQPAEAELPALTQAGWSGPPIIDLTAELHDFSDTAALIEHLDLVISVDTSTAHLAGAMGKPVWVLNRFDTCWRWMLDRDDSPWYPTLKLYRQTTPGDWDSVVERVRDDLIGLVHARRQSTAR